MLRQLRGRSGVVGGLHRSLRAEAWPPRASGRSVGRLLLAPASSSPSPSPAASSSCAVAGPPRCMSYVTGRPKPMGASRMAMMPMTERTCCCAWYDHTGGRRMLTTGGGEQQQQQQQPQPPPPRADAGGEGKKSAPWGWERWQDALNRPNNSRQQQHGDDGAKGTQSPPSGGSGGNSSGRSEPDKDKPPNPPAGDEWNSKWQWLAFGLITVATLFIPINSGPVGSEISFHQLKNELLPEDKIAKLEVVNNNSVKVYLKDDGTRNPRTGKMEYTKPAYIINIGSVENFEKQLEEVQRLLEIDPHHYIPITYSTSFDWNGVLYNWLPPLLLIGFLVLTTRSTLKAGPLKGIFEARSNPAKLYNKETGVKINFSDVAGLEEAKEEIMEFVSFLKFPEQYRALGAKIPKGALLVGPPGTGKTLLAKAAAGEASVPFYSVSGSDFIEMYVGVGPARVRGLFEEARKNAPCIVFIDEIDAVGRARGQGKFRGGGNDERENTLNQLLVEMDGFNSQTGIVVLAGTNRPDILDRALLRPGRFDRQIALDKPDIKSREAIFLVHLKKITTSMPAQDVAPRLAQLTPGFSGADIANICNEAALIAARNNKLSVDEHDFEAAIDRVIGGLEKKNKVLSPEERKTVAYHEAGHAVAAWFLQHCDPLLKVSIVPRGQAALGYAQYLPKDRYLMTQEELFDRMCMALGGRIAEQLAFQQISTGASDDLDKVTRMAYSQVIGYGMNERVGPIAFNPNEESSGRPYSEHLAEIVDEEVRKLVNKAYDTTLTLLQSNFDGLKQVAELLLQKEKIRGEDLTAVLGPRPFKDTVLEDIRHLLPADYEELEKAREQRFLDERVRIQQREEELRGSLDNKSSAHPRTEEGTSAHSPPPQ